MKADYHLIPERIMNNLNGYVKREQQLGGFLTAVMSNNLFAAVARADNEMKPLIPLLCMYIYWELPSGCHGSSEKVKAWLNKE